jgi:hypothetical protein
LDANSPNGNDDTSNMMDFDPPISPVPRDATSEDGSGSESSARKRNKVTVEEVLDVDSLWQSRSGDDDPEDDYIEDFPCQWSAGEPTGGTQRTPFENIWRSQKEAGEEAWGPFENEEEWDLARWLMTSSVSQTKLDEFLKLPIVRTINANEY